MVELRMAVILVCVSLLLVPPALAGGGPTPAPPEVFGCQVADLSCFVACLRAQWAGEFPCGPDPDVQLPSGWENYCDSNCEATYVATSGPGVSASAHLIECHHQSLTYPWIGLAADGQPYQCPEGEYEGNLLPLVDLGPYTVPTGVEKYDDHHPGSVFVVYTDAACGFEEGATLTVYGQGYDGPGSLTSDCPLWIEPA